MKTDLYNQSGDVIGDVNLPDAIFGLKPKINLIHQAVVAQTANGRKVLAHTKDRSEVRGGGIKPWRQKGTGRARHGSIRSPIWSGGGVTFGPTKDRNFSQKINKKAKRQALFMALSSKVKDGQVMLVDDIKFNEAKTKKAKEVLDVLSSKIEKYKTNKKKRDTILLMMPRQDKTLKRVLNNISFVETIGATSLNVLDLLKNKYLLIMKDSIQVIEKHYK